MNTCDPCESIFLTVHITSSSTDTLKNIRYILMNTSNNVIRGTLKIVSSGLNDIIVNDVHLKPGDHIKKNKITELPDALEIINFVTLNNERSRISNIVKSKIISYDIVDVPNPITLQLDGRRFTDAGALAGDILIVISKSTGEKYSHIIKNTDVGVQKVEIELPLKFKETDITDYMFELVPYQATEMRSGKKQEDQAIPYYKDPGFIKRISDDYFTYLMGYPHDFSQDYINYISNEYSAMLARLGNSMPFSIA